MENIKTITQLRNFIKTEEAFTGEFQYKGFGIWWSNYDVRNGIQTPMEGYFRCDPTTDAQYKAFKALNEKMIGAYEWFLS
jgi:hypothetical protein